MIVEEYLTRKVWGDLPTYGLDLEILPTGARREPFCKLFCQRYLGKHSDRRAAGRTTGNDEEEEEEDGAAAGAVLL